MKNPTSIAKGTDSSAYVLLHHVWKHEGHHGGHSWDRLNDAMQKALNLAVTSLMEFGADDFKRFASDFNSGYWIGTPPEPWYSRACALNGYCGDRSRGENPSAQKSFESWTGRKPFYIDEDIDGSRIKLCVGRKFVWFDRHVITRENRVEVKVTSFNDKDKSLTACSYHPRPEGSYEDKIDRRFTITHADIKAHHAAIKAAKKAAEEAKAVASAVEESGTHDCPAEEEED